MCDWTDNNDKENEDSQPPRKKMRKDLSRKVTAKDRFAESSSDVEYAKMTKWMVPRNTQKSTDWALQNFHEWRVERNRIKTL